MKNVHSKLLSIMVVTIFFGMFFILCYSDSSLGKPANRIMAADDEPQLPTVMESEPAKTAKEEPIKALKPEQYVAAYENGLTLAQLQDIFSVRRPRQFGFYRPEDIPNLPSDTFHQLLKEIALQDILYQKAVLQGFTPEEERDKQAIETIKDWALGYALYRHQVEEKLVEVTEEEAKAYYQEHIKEFVSPFNFHIRHIFLSTYKSYTTKEGDTLEGIAERISGDKNALELILSDETKEPRYVKPEEREEKLFAPLKPSEVLLVPMTKQEKQEVYKKMTAIYQDLQEGADFVELAKKYSEAGAPGEVIGPIIPEESEKQLLPEIVAAVEKTPPGQFTKIIETKHGYQIVMVEKKSDKKITPFETAKQRIINTLTNNRRMEIFKEFVEGLIEEGKVIKTYPEVLTGDHPSSAILAEVGQLKYTLEEFKRDLARLAQDLKTPEEKIKLLANHPQIRSAILAREAERRGLDDSQDYKFYLEQRRIAFISQLYLNKLINETLTWTDEEVEKFYQDNINNFTIPKKYKVRQITQQIAEDVSALTPEERKAKVEQIKAELSLVKEKIKNTEDFEKFAKEISDDKYTKEKGGDLGYVTEQYKKAFDGKLVTLEPGQVSEPFELDSQVYMIMVEDIQESQVRLLEEVYEQAKNGLLATKRNERLQSITEELLKEYRFQSFI